MTTPKNPLREYYDQNKGRIICRWHHYFDIYHQHFSKLKSQAAPQNKIVIVEIGVWQGGGLEMWLNYFGKGNCLVIGIDINAACKQVEEEHKGDVQIIIGDQGDTEFLKSLPDKIPRPHIIIDDGGHSMQQQIGTLQALFPYLHDGGVYLCEDTHTSYMPEYGGGYKQPGTFIEHAKNIVDSLHAHHARETVPHDYYTQHCIGLHFYDSIVVLDKSLTIIPAPTTSRTGTKTLH
jgi:cephalosporin hydroxylase